MLFVTLLLGKKSQVLRTELVWHLLFETTMFADCAVWLAIGCEGRIAVVWMLIVYYSHCIAFRTTHFRCVCIIYCIIVEEFYQDIKSLAFFICSITLLLWIYGYRSSNWNYFLDFGTKLRIKWLLFLDHLNYCFLSFFRTVYNNLLYQSDDKLSISFTGETQLHIPHK